MGKKDYNWKIWQKLEGLGSMDCEQVCVSSFYKCELLWVLIITENIRLKYARLFWSSMVTNCSLDPWGNDLNWTHYQSQGTEYKNNGWESVGQYPIPVLALHKSLNISRPQFYGKAGEIILILLTWWTSSEGHINEAIYMNRFLFLLTPLAAQAWTEHSPQNCFYKNYTMYYHKEAFTIKMFTE